MKKGDLEYQNTRTIQEETHNSAGKQAKDTTIAQKGTGSEGTKAQPHPRGEQSETPLHRTGNGTGRRGAAGRGAEGAASRGERRGEEETRGVKGSHCRRGPALSRAAQSSGQHCYASQRTGDQHWEKAGGRQSHDSAAQQ